MEESGRSVEVTGYTAPSHPLQSLIELEGVDTETSEAVVFLAESRYGWDIISAFLRDENPTAWVPNHLVRGVHPPEAT